jgi:hypothetical protein
LQRYISAGLSGINLQLYNTLSLFLERSCQARNLVAAVALDTLDELT